MAELIRKKLSASTLTEVLVAMVIILIVFTIAMGIYSRISTSGVSVSRARAEGEAEVLIREAIAGRNYREEEFDIDGIHYIKTLKPYREQPDLYQINIRAEQGGKVIAMVRQVITIQADED